MDPLPRPARQRLVHGAALVLLLALTGCTLVVQDTRAPNSSPSPAAVAACPRSVPNIATSPDEYYIPTSNGYGNAAATLFTQLWPGNKIIFSPGGPGDIAADGTLAMKWPWYRTVPGALVITGQRLDAPAPPMPTIVLRGPADGYGETGFHPSTLIFPGEGCWEVTGRAGKTSLTFVALVVRSPVDPPWPGWLPDGFQMQDTDITGLPRAIGLSFRPRTAAAGEIRVTVTQGAWQADAPYPLTAQQPVMLDGQPVVCVQGAWDNQHRWRTDADAGVIEWTAGAYSYRVAQVDLGLGCADLVRIAESMS